MSESDRLRAMLDELGIEHHDYDKGGRTQTLWEAPDMERYFCFETEADSKTSRLTISWFPTAEQAIAATLGSDRLTAEQVRDAVLENFEEMQETYYDHWEPSKFDWQAIADELNAELGSDRPTAGQELPAGLTISDDGMLLNWCGENYTKQDKCGDDRFELIDRAKRRLLESTNIESRPEEVAVLDSILFRCWQMGWLNQLRDDEWPSEDSFAAHLLGVTARQDERIAELEMNWNAAKDSANRWRERCIKFESRCYELESLVRDMWLKNIGRMDTCGYCVMGCDEEERCDFERRMRELGVM